MHETSLRIHTLNFDTLSLAPGNEKAPAFLCRCSLEVYKSSIARDNFNGRPALHVNMGRRDLGIETVNEGWRNLSPLRLPEEWPTTVKGLRFFISEVLQKIYNARTLADGSMVHLYTPFLSYQKCSGFAQKLMHKESAALKHDENYRNRNLEMKMFCSGPQLVIS
jgi:hypothetical protein